MNRSLINEEWWFFRPDQEAPEPIDLPHTWNGEDGQDGGNNYKRLLCTYEKTFVRPLLEEGGRCLLEFKGANADCEVFVNDQSVAKHRGGYSTFHADITEGLQQENTVKVVVSNIPNNEVYPQLADFTFYGGLYRDVSLLIFPKNHLAFGKHASPRLQLTTGVNGTNGTLVGKVNVVGEGEARITVYEDSRIVATGKPGETIVVPNCRLWQGRQDPFLYTVRAELVLDGEVVDTSTQKIGFRTYVSDPQKGFLLNGKPYPLRGVCRHQDRPHIGNALTKAMHEEDAALIYEIGATTVRLAHYQHDQYFYDLCDKLGFVVWAEIPMISRYLPKADQNAMLQMEELILQNYNHPSICYWGLSNEISMFGVSKENVAQHHRLQALCERLDPTRKTVLATFMVATKNSKLMHISDVVSYNLYFGWYLPFVGLNGRKLDAFHKRYPNRAIGLSEYGAEAMPNLHAKRPKRGDNTEEYQCIYHEQLLTIINARPYLWATHVWNMFDFAADLRNQGGEPGRNHKGLVTFDRATKKDAFYLYKAHWASEEFVHIAGKRYQNRTGKRTQIKVYTNQKEVELFVNGTSVGKQSGNHVFVFDLALTGTLQVEAKCGALSDVATFYKVQKADPSYRISRKKNSKISWQKQKN